MILIADRESDIYVEWATLPDARFALLTRTSRDRKPAGGERPFAATADWPEADRIVLDLPPRKGRPARRALLALKYGTVRICRPRHCSTPGLPETVTLQLVEVEELAAAPDPSAAPTRSSPRTSWFSPSPSTAPSKADRPSSPTVLDHPGGDGPVRRHRRVWPYSAMQ